MSKNSSTWSRIIDVTALLAALVTAGGISGYQADRTTSAGDTIPRCC